MYPHICAKKGRSRIYIRIVRIVLIYCTPAEILCQAGWLEILLSSPTKE